MTITFCGPLGGRSNYAEYDMNVTWECHRSALQYGLHGVLQDIDAATQRADRLAHQGQTVKASNLRKFIEERVELAEKYRVWIDETPCTHANPRPISDLEAALPVCTCG